MNNTYKKLVSSLVCFTFLFTSISYAEAPSYQNLGPRLISQDPDQQTVVKAAAGRLTAMRYPIPVGLEEYPSDFATEYDILKKMSGVNNILPDYADIPDGWTKFAAEEWAEYKNDITGHSLPEHFLQLEDPITALEFFAKNEARSLGYEVKDVVEGWFPYDKEKGELPIARIEPATDGTYTIVLHTEFVQRWKHIRQNDVWFETDLDGEKRVVSYAWSLLFWVAKHEMSDLRRRVDRGPKGGGHIFKGIPSLLTERTANNIGGRYAEINEAMRLAFLHGYCVNQPSSFTEAGFKNRAREVLSPSDEDTPKEERLEEEFPVLSKKSPTDREVFIQFAFLTHYLFSTDNDRKKRIWVRPIETSTKRELIRDYEERVKKHPGLEKEAMKATGAETGLGDQEQEEEVPSDIEIEKLTRKDEDFYYALKTSSTISYRIKTHAEHYAKGHLPNFQLKMLENILEEESVLIAHKTVIRGIFLEVGHKGTEQLEELPKLIPLAEEAEKREITRIMAEYLKKAGDRIGSSMQSTGRPTSPGKSPEDATRVIAFSEHLREVLDEKGYFTVDNYLTGYREARTHLGFDSLAKKVPQSTARRDLNTLVDRGILKKQRIKKGYGYSLTSKGSDLISDIQLDSFDIEVFDEDVSGMIDSVDLSDSLDYDISFDEQMRDDLGRFSDHPGKSPEDTLKVLATSNLLQATLNTNAGFTVEEYLVAYRETYKNLHFEPLAEHPENTVRRDLNALVEQGILLVDKSEKSYKYKATEKGLVEIREIIGNLNKEKSNIAVLKAMDAAEKLRIPHNIAEQIEHLRNVIESGRETSDMANLLASAIAHAALADHEGEDQHLDPLLRIANLITADQLTRNIASAAIRTIVSKVILTEKMNKIKKSAEQLENNQGMEGDVAFLEAVVETYPLDEVVEDNTKLMALVLARSALVKAGIGETEKHLADLIVVGSLSNTDDEVRNVAHDTLQIVAKKDMAKKDVEMARECAEKLRNNESPLKQLAMLLEITKKYDIDTADENGILALVISHAALFRSKDGVPEDHERIFLLASTSTRSSEEVRQIARSILTERAAAIKGIEEVKEYARIVDSGEATPETIKLLEDASKLYTLDEAIEDELKMLFLTVSHAALLKAEIGSREEHETTLAMMSSFPTATDEIREIAKGVLAPLAKRTKIIEGKAGRPTSPGKSPDDALKVLALSESMRKNIESQGHFTLKDYLAAYEEVRDLLGFEPLAVNPESTARRDLDALVERGLVAIDKSNLPYAYNLLDPMSEIVSVLRSELVVPLAIKAYKNEPRAIIINAETMDYAWGDKDFLPELLGFENIESKPYAELWIGAHPKAPAVTTIDGTEVKLDELIHGASEEILGKDVSANYNKTLPYLFKILPAATALSIQSHPNKKQAEEGWAREKGEGPNYRDDNHKPEIICAITKFWALNGFRPVEDILASFEGLGIYGLKYEMKVFGSNVKGAGSDKEKKKEALKHFYSSIMKKVARLKEAEAKEDKSEADLAQAEITKIVSAVIKRARQRLAGELEISEDSTLEEFVSKAEEINKVIEMKRELWALRLDQQYPNDMGVLSAYLLNLVRLNPGEAMYLPAGELHAYLGKLDPETTDEGAGIELMANSDNVLRGGLTPKHVDVNELLSTLTFNAGEPEILTPKEKSTTESVYETSAPEFELSVIELERSGKYFINSETVHSADALIVMEGEVYVIDSEGNELTLKKGQTFLVPAAIDVYMIHANSDSAKLFKASVPIKEKQPEKAPEQEVFEASGQQADGGAREAVRDVEDAPASAQSSNSQQFIDFIVNIGPKDIPDEDGVDNNSNISVPKDEYIWETISDLLDANDVGFAIETDFELDKEIEDALKGKGRGAQRRRLEVGIKTFSKNQERSLRTAVNALKGAGKKNVVILTIDAKSVPQDIADNLGLFEDTMLFNMEEAPEDIKQDVNLRRLYQARIIMSMLTAASAKADTDMASKFRKVQVIRYLITPYLKDSSDFAADEFIGYLFGDSKNVLERFSSLIDHILSYKPVRAFNKRDELEVLKKFWTYA